MKHCVLLGSSAPGQHQFLCLVLQEPSAPKLATHIRTTAPAAPLDTTVKVVHSAKFFFFFFLLHMTRITIWWFLFSENNKVKPTIGIVYGHPPLHKVTPNKSEVLHTAKLNRGRHSCSWQPTRSTVSFSHGCEIIQLHLFKVTMLKKLLGTFFFSLVPTHMCC